MREGYADLSEVRLHYVEAGEGPLVLLLHGFPDFWYSWRFQIPALAGAGFRVVAPDMRGYNLSSRPLGLAAYATARLAGDVRDLIAERSSGSGAFLAGHDWGAAVAWLTAIRHPEAIERLAILNVPHPRRMVEAVRRPGRQLLRSWYMFFFQLPWLPERLLAADDWRGLRRPFADARPGAFTAADLERYKRAWSDPGAVTAMLNYYRAALRRPPGGPSGRSLPPVQAPTLVIWGERDRHLGAELAEPYAADVPHLEGVVRLPHASHWVQHDEPDRVSELLIDFFRG
ncbi:MAG TPA: alpha/beta fold hydrolase [Acidimicrobiales bacterium]|nr:alpha/beta fold hydrolase [Acidimicrobiales bacterium]